MTKSPQKKTERKKTEAQVPTDPNPLETKIQKLLHVLNDPDYKCEFWRSEHRDYHIVGVRPVTKTTIEILNADGYNPYRKEIGEIVFKYYKIFIVDSNDQYNMTLNDLDRKRTIEMNGTIYLKHNDLIWIVDYIRNRS